MCALAEVPVLGGVPLPAKARTSPSIGIAKVQEDNPKVTLRLKATHDRYNTKGISALTRDMYAAY
jgi:hypothetical protein